ncbi:unnamed protein product [Sphagnum jensenii]|uniref:Uncharacterized protein n=1 Tax=Sphagnum jensenii TaxID=128206 RepID=A0ABP0WIR5_9BRYO
MESRLSLQLWPPVYRLCGSLRLLEGALLPVLMITQMEQLSLLESLQDYMDCLSWPSSQHFPQKLLHPGV